MASDPDGEGFVELREDPPSTPEGAYLVVETEGTTSSFVMGSFSFRFEGDGTDGYFFIGDEGAAADEFNFVSFGDVIAYSGDAGASADFLAFGNDSNYFQSTGVENAVLFWSPTSVPGFGPHIDEDACFTFDPATCTLTVTNIAGSPSFSLVEDEVVFGSATGGMEQDAAFTYDGTTLSAPEVVTTSGLTAGTDVVVLGGAFYDLPNVGNPGALVFVGSSFGKYVTDVSGLSFSAAGDDLTVGDDVFAGGLVSSDLTAGGIPYIGTAGRLAYDPGLLYNAGTDAINLGAGNITLSGAIGYARIGTSTAANGGGDLSAGLSGAQRWDWDTGASAVTVKDSSAITRSLLDAANGTFEMRDTSGAVWRTRMDDGGNFIARTAGAAQVVSIGVSADNVFNDNGSASRNFRVESDTLTHAFFVDAATDRIGFNDSSPDADFDFASGTESFQLYDSSNYWVLDAPDGDMRLIASSVDFLRLNVSTTPDELRVNDGAADLDFVVEGANRNVLVVDASINTAELFGVLSTEPATATISGGAITITSSYVIVDTEGGAASDDLDYINAGTGVTLRQGMVLFLQQANDARDVTLRDGAGNIQCNTNQTITNAYAGYLLVFNGVVWCRIGGNNSN